MAIKVITSIGALLILSLGVLGIRARSESTTKPTVTAGQKPSTAEPETQAGDKADQKKKPNPAPVGKPEEIPEEIKKIFSADTKITLQEKLTILKKQTSKDKFEDVEDALRWLIHQPSYAEALRDAATKALMGWRTSWLTPDLQSMVKDEGHAMSWRSICLSNLSVLHSISLEDDAYDAVAESATSTHMELRNTSLASLSRLCRSWNWHNTNPDKLKFLSDFVKRSLKSKNASERAQGLRAIEVASLTKEAATVERFANNPKEPVEVREAALYAMGRIPTANSLAILDASFTSKEEKILKAAKTIQPFVLTAQLDHADKSVRERVFKELTNLGPAAYFALQNELNKDDSKKQRLAKAILGEAISKSMKMKLLDRTDMKIFGADPKKNIQGVPTVLMDIKTRRIAIEGEFCLEVGPLEYAVVCKGENAKLHESGIALHCSPLDICYALLACNYTFAGELRSNGKINLPKGAGVMISVECEREVHSPDGVRKEKIRLPLEGYIWNAATGSPMKRVPWAFTGSKMTKLPNGQQVMVAMIEKSVVAIKSDPNALLNTPLDTAALSDVNPEEGAYYEINQALVPKRGTKCWLVFEPWSGEKSKDGFFSDKKAKTDAKK